MADPVTLQQLAEVRFHPLSDAEVKLVQAAPKGETAHCGAPAPDGQVPARQPSDGTPRLLLPITSARFLRGFRWFQICAGWILATLFVAGVTGVIRKD